MRRAARILAAIYGLAILVAGLGPHCGAMFAGTEASAAPAPHHAGHAPKAPGKAPGQDCAAMAMAKLAGPVPAVSALAPPDAVATLPVLPALHPQPAMPGRVVQPGRGPPRETGGFAAAFARNHRLLI